MCVYIYTYLFIYIYIDIYIYICIYIYVSLCMNLFVYLFYEYIHVSGPQGGFHRARRVEAPVPATLGTPAGPRLLDKEAEQSWW